VWQAAFVIRNSISLYLPCMYVKKRMVVCFISLWLAGWGSMCCSHTCNPSSKCVDDARFSRHEFLSTGFWGIFRAPGLLAGHPKEAGCCSATPAHRQTSIPVFVSWQGFPRHCRVVVVCMRLQCKQHPIAVTADSLVACLATCRCIAVDCCCNRVEASRMCPCHVCIIHDVLYASIVMLSQDVCCVHYTVAAVTLVCGLCVSVRAASLM
jgi:hypothetical protein